MDKFTKITSTKKKEVEVKDDILFKNDYLSVINYEDWSFVKENDMVICIPYLVEYNQIILRQEYIPTFKYVDGQEYHLTVLSGTIEEGETPEDALYRELQEEAGIIVYPNVKLEFLKPLYLSKGNTARYHVCILQLDERSYDEVKATGDGSKLEAISSSVKVDLKYINSLNPSDLITTYAIEMFKKYNNIP